MKILIEKFKESLRSIIQIVLMACAFIAPVKMDACKWIKFFFLNSKIDFETAKYYFLLKVGNWGIGLVLMIYILYKIRKSNEKKLFNHRNVYHNYPYIWYWICANVLGYTKCNLKLVPIYMQFKLVLNDVFEKYDVGSEDDYPLIEDEEILVKKINWESRLQEVNLVLADTYPISKNQLPNSKKILPTLVITRNRPDQSRYYSPRFITKIVDEVRRLSSDTIVVNVFPTTNANHTKKIAENAFKLADRANVKKLIVFQQSNKGRRKFEEKGKIIYNYR